MNMKFSITKQTESAIASMHLIEKQHLDSL